VSSAWRIGLELSDSSVTMVRDQDPFGW
jgi:hypothetical protein